MDPAEHIVAEPADNAATHGRVPGRGPLLVDALADRWGVAPGPCPRKTVWAELPRPEAQAELRKIPRDMALRILVKLTELETDPLGFSTTTLVSQPDRRRLRVGDHRVGYTIDHGELLVWVVHVGHRSTVYDT